jgi:sugar phosphate isomerase/epimerase
MRWSINQITLAGGSRQPPEDLARDLAAVRAGGWHALEAWLPHWDPYVERHGLSAARRLLDESGLVAAGGCGLRDGPGGRAGLFFSEGDELRGAHDALERRLEQCQALGATHLVTSPGFQLPEDPRPGDLDRAEESLRRAGERAAHHGVRLGIEFLAAARLVSTLPTALTLAQRTGDSNVGVVVDTYHLYAGRSKSEDLDLFETDRSRLFFVHVSDVDASIPRDLWTVPARTLPGDASEDAGGIPNGALLERVRALGYDADVSLELFSAAFEARWREDPVAAARLAYARCTALVPGGAATT